MTHACLWMSVALLCAVPVGVPLAGAQSDAEGELVVLRRPVAEAPWHGPVVARLRAELLGAGFELIVLQSDDAAEPEGAFAQVRLMAVRDEPTAWIDLFGRHGTETHVVSTPDVESGVEILGLRVVESLRAARERERSPAPVAPPEAAPIHERGSQPHGRPPGHLLSVAGSGAWDPGGAVAFGGELRLRVPVALDRRLALHFGLTALPLASTFESSLGGSARVRRTMGTVGLELGWGQRVHFGLGVLGGLLHLRVTGDAPVESGSEQLFAAVVGLDASLYVPLSRRVRLRVGTAALAALPSLTLRIGEERVGRISFPSLMLTVGLGFELSGS